MEYYLAIKRNEVYEKLIHATTEINLNVNVLSEINHAKIEIKCMGLP